MISPDVIYRGLGIGTGSISFGSFAPSLLAIAEATAVIMTSPYTVGCDRHGAVQVPWLTVERVTGTNPISRHCDKRGEL